MPASDRDSRAIAYPHRFALVLFLVLGVAVGTTYSATIPASAASLWAQSETNSNALPDSEAPRVDHPFWDVTTHTWTLAANLKSGDQMLSDDGSLVTVAGLTAWTGSQWMWDLTLGNLDDFFVVAGSSTMLVHNCGFSKPTNVSDTDLQRIVDRVYKGEGSSDQIGNGSIADAARSELRTGLPTKGRWHIQAAQDTASQINTWLGTNSGASAEDIFSAQGMLQDLLAASFGE